MKKFATATCVPNNGTAGPSQFQRVLLNKARRVGRNGKASTAFAIDSIEQQGTHTIEISIGGSPDKNIYVVNVFSCRECQYNVMG